MVLARSIPQIILKSFFVNISRCHVKIWLITPGKKKFASMERGLVFKCWWSRPLLIKSAHRRVQLNHIVATRSVWTYPEQPDSHDHYHWEKTRWQFFHLNENLVSQGRFSNIFSLIKIKIILNSNLWHSLNDKARCHKQVPSKIPNEFIAT